MTDDPILAAARAVDVCSPMGDISDELDQKLVELNAAINEDKPKHWPWRPADDPPETHGEIEVSDDVVFAYKALAGGIRVVTGNYHLNSHWSDDEGGEISEDVLGWLPLPGGE